MRGGASSRHGRHQALDGFGARTHVARSPSTTSTQPSLTLSAVQLGPFLCDVAVAQLGAGADDNTHAGGKLVEELTLDVPAQLCIQVRQSGGTSAGPLWLQRGGQTANNMAKQAPIATGQERRRATSETMPAANPRTALGCVEWDDG